MPFMRMKHAKDPIKDIWDTMGDISEIELLHNQVLVAIYVRPDTTASGIILSDKTIDEDKYQGKVGLIIKTGPGAFQGGGSKWDFGGLKIGEWVFFRPSDSWQINVQGKSCRIVEDIDIRGRLPAPDVVW